MGKSTLFNRLTGKKMALVDAAPGLTRDWQEGAGSIGDLSFTLIDTAGFENEKDGSLAHRMWDQTQKAIEIADIILFVVDSKEGILPLDMEISERLRLQSKPVLLVANKGESSASRLQAYEAYSLGLDDPIFISASQGTGLSDLYTALKTFFTHDKTERPPPTSFEKEKSSVIDLAVMGRPNAGKSTFINALLHEERLLTGPEAGITRDAISIPFTFKDHPFRLIDTAGIRKRAKVTDPLEKLSVSDSFESLKYAQGIVLLMDAENPFEHQDITIAHHIMQEGRFLVIALNKWDLISQKEKALSDMKYLLEKNFPYCLGLPCIPISAATSHNLDAVLDAALRMYALWNTHVGTSELNGWLSNAIQEHAPPLIKGRRLKIKYITQTKARPPTFIAFSNLKESVWPDAYKRYLLNSLRRHFKLEGIPLRLLVRTSENPYTPS